MHTISKLARVLTHTYNVLYLAVIEWLQFETEFSYSIILCFPQSQFYVWFPGVKLETIPVMWVI